MAAIPDAEVRAEVDRILAGKGFANAGRLSKLLRYVVEKTLANETDQLKEYSVGVEVFERDETYDPRLDSIVRVEAGRLRSRLDEYYNGEGAASPVRIVLPRGGYSAQFAHRPPSPTATEGRPDAAPVSDDIPTARSRRSWTGVPLGAGLICAIAAMVVWLAGWNRQPVPDTRPSMAVLAFHSHPIGADGVKVAERLTEGVTSELARLGTVGVASHTSAMQFAGQHRPMKDISTALNAEYVVEASVDDEAGNLLVVVRIVNAATDRKMWVADYRGAPDDIRGISQRIAFDVSAAILERPRTTP